MSETADLPTIDLRTSRGGDAAAAYETARSIWDAISQYGFFYVKNHEVPQELIDRTRRHFASFYAAPVEEKQKVKGNIMRGYTGFLELGLGAAVHSTDYAVNDLCERLSFGREVSEEERAADEYYRAPFASMVPSNQWPTTPAGFKQVALEYFSAMDHLFQHLMSLIALAADLPGDFWQPHFTKNCNMLCGINYPEPPAELYQPGVLRLKEHADLDLLTILQHENPPNGGAHLEVLIGNRWQAAPAKPDTLLVNIGEVLEIITWGRLKATRHRVALPEHAAGSHRLSLVFFAQPNYDAVFDTIPMCVPKGEVPRRFSYQEYLTNFFSKVRGHDG